ncbi:MAG: alpha/beta fold hydrolase [bacterium]|nr:alpha/beta fold hydrolase [bacterium]
MKILMLTIFLIVIIIICGDFIYSRIVKYRLKKWEKNIKRDSDDIREGCKEFSVGNGDIGLLLIHGFGDSPAVYRNFALALSETNFTCKIMRLPGFALPMTAYSKTNSKQWVEKLEQEIYQLKQKHKCVWIIAHSLGGATTIKYLLNNSQKVDGVILIAPLLKVSSRQSFFIPARILYQIANYCLFFTKIFENYLPLDLYDPTIKHQFDRFIPKIIYKELFNLLDNVKGKAKKINIPFLMILSKNDLIVDGKEAEHFYNQVSSPYKNILILKNSGHMIPLDYEWKNVVSTISTFILNKP